MKNDRHTYIQNDIIYLQTIRTNDIHKDIIHNKEIQTDIHKIKYIQTIQRDIQQERKKHRTHAIHTLRQIDIHKINTTELNIKKEINQYRKNKNERTTKAITNIKWINI